LKTPDFLIIGGGVIGLSLAIELKQRHPDQSVTVLEKETELGYHASGRNSGVLHAGFYYTADSLKAKFTREGNEYWTNYCDDRKLTINKCGKLVVAKNAEELEGIDELKRRGDLNNVPLQVITEQEAKEIEPRVKTHEKALWSPITSTVSPMEVLAQVDKEAREMGIEVLSGEPYVRRTKTTIFTENEKFQAGFVINSAGLYADRIAKDFGFGQNYTMVPFKGLYLYASDEEHLNTNIYPVPNLKNPFLGVHYTVTVEGHAKIGPTAIPAFWREHYKGLSRFSLAEFMQVAGIEASLFLRAGFDFRSLAVQELRKYWRPYLVGQASLLIDGVQLKRYRKWGKAGIRAQLLDRRTQKLVMDFLTESDDKSFHVLNAVSPGFTCAVPFARYICDQIAAAA
jgi:L-2-hydroxyglutarate oxidase